MKTETETAYIATSQGTPEATAKARKESPLEASEGRGPGDILISDICCFLPLSV